jgi:hypothetical protein
MVVDQCEAVLLPSPTSVGYRSTPPNVALSDRRFQGLQIPDPRGTPRRLAKSPVQLNDLPQREVSHQARRRYNSSFFFNTRSAATLKSSPH